MNLNVPNKMAGLDVPALDESKVDIVNPPAIFKSAVCKSFGFLKSDSKKVVCRECYIILPYSGNTTNMFTHLRRHHGVNPQDINNNNGKQKSSEPVPNRNILQKSTDNQTRLEHFKVVKLSGEKKELINLAIMNFIVQDMRPFRIVESPSFVSLVKLLEPKYKLPSRQYFSETLLPSMYSAGKEKVAAKLGDAQFVALTTDGWTSRATQSYVTITTQFIDSDWNMQSFVLQTRIMEENHTGVNIAQVLLNAVAEWNLTSKAPALVSDNAANMVVAAKESKLSPFVRCFAHTLNLAAQRGLKVKQVSVLLAKIRRIVVFFHKSSVAATTLVRNQKLLSLPNHKLKIDVCTRWNSAYDMIERFLEQQPAIFAAFQSLKDLRKRENDLALLSDSDITNAEDVMKTMAPLKSAIQMMCTEQGPTLSVILPLLSKLLQNFKPDDGDSTLTRNLKTTMREDLEKRYTEDREVLQIATVIDPRFKDLPFLDENEKNQIMLRLTTLAISKAPLDGSFQTQMIKQEPESLTVEPQPGRADPMPMQHTLPSLVPPLPALPDTHTSTAAAADSDITAEKSPPKKKSALDDLLGDVFIQKVEVLPKKSPLEKVNLEIIQYQKEKPLSLTGNPLNWWKEHEIFYPFLSHLAKLYLGIPATSVPSERVFSSAGDIISAQRATLKPEYVDMMIFLKKNL
ncbi:E3 SUMO-protein ligase ZBED1-like [Saccostrea cucullata]|uniref:E3 SUMO-protein ligase ZBED1-like n=1 Tax=Saccostrea cuccullata TaxID=36930 RepID=UPI002ED26D72